MDIATLDSETRTGFNGNELVCSDEFENTGWTPYPGEDPFWEFIVE